MTYPRGTVVHVWWPHSDLVHVSKRPALVVQDERVYIPLPQQVCVMITTKVTHVGPACIPVPRNSAERLASGLDDDRDSFIATDCVATVENAKIVGRIGDYPRMDRVDTALRLVLNLPGPGPAR